MTTWKVPRELGTRDADLFGFLRWNLGSNVSITRTRSSKLQCDVVGTDVIEDVSGVPSSRKVSLRLGLEYSLSRKAGATMVSGPGRIALHRAVTEKYRSLGQNSENALLPQLFQNLTRIPAIHQVMTPLRAFVLELSEVGSVRPTDRSFKRYDPKKAKQYLSILQDLGYVKLEGDRYVPAGPLTTSGTSYGESAQIVPMILADSIRKASGYMVGVLGWRLMVPYLRWSNAYYWKALEAERLPTLSKAAWTESHVMLYGSPTHGNPRTQMDDMVRGEIVSFDGRGFTGVDEVFQPYRRQALEIPLVKEVLAAA